MQIEIIRAEAQEKLKELSKTKLDVWKEFYSAAWLTVRLLRNG